MKIKISKHFAANILITYSVVYLSFFVLFETQIGRITKYIFYACMIIGIALYVYQNLMSIKSKTEKLPRKVIFSFLICMLFYTFRCIFVNNTHQMINAFYQYIFYTVMFLGMFYLVNVCDIEFELRLLRFIGPFLGVLGVIEAVSKKYFVGTINALDGYSYLYVDENNSVRSIVFSNSFLTYGMIMAIFGIISFFFFIKKKNVFNFVLMMASISGLLSSGSRGPLMGMVLGCIYIYLFLNSDKINAKLIKKIFILVFFAVIFVLVFLMMSNHSTYIAMLFQKMKSIFEWKSSGTSNFIRTKQWAKSISLINTDLNLLTGIGPAATGRNTGFVTESGLLKRLLEMGLPIALLFYSFLIITIKSGIKKSKINMNPYAALAVGIIIAVLVEDTILQITEEISIMFFFWFAVSLLFRKNNN